MSNQLEELKKELAFYRQKFSIAEHDVATRGFLTYVKLVGDMVDYIADFNIKAKISGDKKETPEYERAEKIWKEMPEMITAINNLKTQLGVEYNPNEGKAKVEATKPENMAFQKS